MLHSSCQMAMTRLVFLFVKKGVRKMVFTHDIEEWLQEVDLWTRRESEDLVAALRQGRSVGMFEFATSADCQQCFIMTAHANCVLVLPSSQARCELAALLCRSVDGHSDGGPMAHLFFPSTSAPQTGTASRLM